MDEPARSNWERGATKSRRSCLILLLVSIVIVACVVAGVVWLFNSPGMRVAGEIYDAAPDIVTRTHYAALTGSGDTLTIFVARDVTRDEAIRLQCQIVIPLLLREHLTARIVIQHPDNDFQISDRGHHLGFRVGTVLDVLPVARRQLALGAVVESPVIIVDPEPVAERDHPVDLDLAHGEHVHVDDSVGTLEQPMLEPFGLADSQHVTGRLHRRDVGSLLG
jgi:hypothetical protein